jgi:hypothetical protein
MTDRPTCIHVADQLFYFSATRQQFAPKPPQPTVIVKLRQLLTNKKPAPDGIPERAKHDKDTPLADICNRRIQKRRRKPAMGTQRRPLRMES